MRLTVNGIDRADTLGAELEQAAAALRRTHTVRSLSPGHSALSLLEADSGEDRIRRLLELTRLRHGIRTDDFEMPVRPGRLGQLILKFKQRLWRALRYQHDRIAFQQNLVNELVIHTLETLHAEHGRERDALRARLAALEARDAAAPVTPTPGEEA